MGFFDEAEVNLNEVPDDPFGFGNDFWPVFIKEVKAPEITKSGERYGMMITWAVDHPAFEGTQVADQLGYGNWFQLPVPKPLQGQVPFDPNGKDKQVLFNLKNLLLALGFSVDEMGAVGPQEMIGRRCFAKIKARQNEMGFWQFNVYAFKPIPKDANGMEEFAPGTTKNPAPAADEDILTKELNDI